MIFLGIIVIFWFITCATWPYMFVTSFLRAQKKIRRDEDYSDEERLATISLFIMTVLPILVVLFFVS